MMNICCDTIAYQEEKSTTVSLLEYIELVYAFAADIFIFGASFTILEIVGACIITFFNVVTLVERGKMEEEEDQRKKEVKNVVSELKQI